MGLASSGCAPQASSSTADLPAAASKPAAKSSANETKPATGQTAPSNPPSAAASQSPAATPGSPSTVPVVLGDARLTTGIPGASNPLKLSEIKQWLDDPQNHLPIEATLPLGLAEGQSQIKGLDANPLTRAKVELGRQLFFEKRLSSDGTISCASCHDPAHNFAAPTQFGVGVRGQTGDRNSPVAYNRILSDKQFWDGRADSLEAQAIGPIANPIEMANTHEQAVKTLAEIEGYRLQFEKIFGGVTIENVGRAIASFERVVVTGATPYDYQKKLDSFAEVDLDELKTDDPEAFAQYLAAKKDVEAHPMDESAKRGQKLYFSNKANCSACHVGANLTDEQYYNIGVGMAAENPDVGRAKISGQANDTGAFKTPTIRSVARSAPYMHDGSQKTLEEVVEFYAKGGHPNPHLHERIKKLDLTDQDKQDLVAFMKACTGDFPVIVSDHLPE